MNDLNIKIRYFLKIMTTTNVITYLKINDEILKRKVNTFVERIYRKAWKALESIKRELPKTCQWSSLGSFWKPKNIGSQKNLRLLL